MTREEIARVIAPDAWRKVDRLRRNADTSDQTSEKVRGIWRNEATDLAKSSLAKADAILAKFHQDAGSGELVEKLAAHIWTNIAGHPGAPAFAHEYGWSEEWPSDGELVRDLVRTIAKSALSYRAADALERGSQVGEIVAWRRRPIGSDRPWTLFDDRDEAEFYSSTGRYVVEPLYAAPAHGGGG